MTHRYRIRICTAHETALQTCLASNAKHAWDMAFDLARQLLGEVPLRHRIEVRRV